jgi:glycine betaine transporter
VLLVPTVFSILWFAVLGGSGLYEEMHGDGGIAQLVTQDVTIAMFSLFDRFPLSKMLTATALALVFIFLVTSVDSATFVCGMLTSHGSMDPPLDRRLAWGVVLGAMGAALGLTDSVAVIRAITVTGAIPYLFVLLLQTAALFRVIGRDAAAATASGNDEER